MAIEKNWQRDFEAAMGEEFSEAICPPILFELASPHECCEVIWDVVGVEVTPTSLASLAETKLEELAARFGRYFEVDQPSVAQIKEAITNTLRRWPAGSLEEGA